MTTDMLEVFGFRISSPLEKLGKKFGFADDRVPFDLYDGYRTPAERAGSSNVLELEDILITVAMNSQIRANATLSFWHGLKNRKSWYMRSEELLGQLPLELGLADASDDQLSRISELFDRLSEVDGVKTAVAGKILCRKRPRLIPMLDSVVLPRLCQFAMDEEGRKEFGEVSSGEWKDIGRALRFLREVCQRGREPLRRLCASFRELPGNFELSELRAFESLLWWEANPKSATTDPRLLGYERRWGRQT